jgi:hypothetical protein
MVQRYISNAIDIGVLYAISGFLDVSLALGIVLRLYGSIILLELIAAAFGTRQAAASRSRYLMARVFRRLGPEDQDYLIEMAKTAPQPEP